MSSKRHETKLWPPLDFPAGTSLQTDPLESDARCRIELISIFRLFAHDQCSLRRDLLTPVVLQTTTQNSPASGNSLAPACAEASPRCCKPSALDGAEAQAARRTGGQLHQALLRNCVPGRQPIQPRLPPVLLLLQPPALGCVALQHSGTYEQVRKASRLYVGTHVDERM